MKINPKGTCAPSVNSLGLDLLIVSSVDCTSLYKKCFIHDWIHEANHSKNTPWTKTLISGRLSVVDGTLYRIVKMSIPAVVL